MDYGEVAVLIPCYNEVETISNVIQDFGEHLPYARIYVGDNNSTDGSFKKAKSCSDRYHVACSRYPVRGRGYVIKRILHDIDADIYVIVDADGSYRASDAMTLVAGVHSGHDLVLGQRDVTKGSVFSKKPFAVTGNKIVRHFVGKTGVMAGIFDVMTGCMALSGKFAKQCHLASDGFSATPEIIMEALKYLPADKIGTVPVNYTARRDGTKSKFGIVDWLRVIEDVIAIS